MVSNVLFMAIPAKIKAIYCLVCSGTQSIICQDKINHVASNILTRSFDFKVLDMIIHVCTEKKLYLIHMKNTSSPGLVVWWLQHSHPLAW